MNGFKNEFAGMFNVGVMVKVPLSGWWEGSYKRNSARAETRIKSLELQDAREKVELQVNQSVYKVNEANKKLIVPPAIWRMRKRIFVMPISDLRKA